MARRKSPFMPDNENESLPYNFAVTAQIRGKFTTEQLADALVKLRQKHPAVAGHFVMDGDTPYYDSDNVPPFAVRVVIGEWTAEVERELAIKFDLLTGPATRFVLVHHPEDSDLSHIIMTCNHAIADGLSAAYALRDTLHYMANPEALVESLPMSPEMFLILPPHDPEKLPLTKPLPAPERKVRQVEDKYRLFVVPELLTPIQTAALVARCRREQTSVHAALIVAFLVGITKLEGEAPVRILSSPVNVRGPLSQYADHPLDEHFGNYINPSVHTRIEGTDHRDFWEMAREAKASLTSETEGDKIYKTLYWFIKMFQDSENPDNDKEFDFWDGDKVAPYDLSITNLGQLNFAVDYGNVCLEAIFGPAVNPLGSEKVMGVSTVGGRLSFLFVAPYRLIDKPEAQQLMRIAIDELGSAVGW
jgi:hypothetical protein